MKLLYKCSDKLVGKRTKAHKSFLLTELYFTDDVVITTSTREDIIKAIMELRQVTTESGLTISFPITKLLVSGTVITCTEADLAPLSIGSSVIKSVPSFRYLRSSVKSHGERALDLDDKVARASKLLELLESLFFQDRSLSRQTEKMIYQAVMLGVLYAAETCPPKQRSMRRLEDFHHHCLRNILGISRVQQCIQHISNEMITRHTRHITVSSYTASYI